MVKKENTKWYANQTFTGTLKGDILCLVFGVIVGFVIPFLLWIVTINYFLLSLSV